MADLHLVATAFMAGLIVFVQVVHYPLMARVGAEEFVGYETEHTTRTGFVVIPAMLVELGTAIWLTVNSFGSDEGSVATAGLLLLGLIWISTAVLQAPAHGRLVHGFDATVHARLVRTNWIRSGAWLARIPLAVILAG